jgi:hypothetical protein
MRRPFLRILTFFRSSRADAEISRELAAHVRLLEDDFVARGMTPDEARFAARRAFAGQLEQTKLRSATRARSAFSTSGGSTPGWACGC